MKLFKTKKRMIAVGLTAALAVGASGAAFAFWTQGGSGTGSATTGNTTGITVNQTSVTASSIYPGGPAEALSGNFDNSNSGAVSISSVTAAVHAFSSQADLGKPACTEADYAIGGSSGATVVPSGTGVGSWSGLNVSLLNGAGNQDNCKGVTITIDYTANA